MNDKKIEDEVKKIVNELVEDLIIADVDTNLKDYMDSIKLVSLIVELEERFNIVISDEDFAIENFRTIHNISILVKKYLLCE